MPHSAPSTQKFQRLGDLFFVERILECKCQFCWGKPTIKEVAKVIIARINDRISTGYELTGAALDALRMLARSREPIGGATFQQMLPMDDRSVKALMKDICDEWAVPVIASRKPPYGYFVAATPSEFSEWERVMRSQAISMLVRCRRLRIANFAELAGQQPIDFVNEFSVELRDAIEPGSVPATSAEVAA